MKVKELMTKNPVSIKKESTISEALSKMERNKIHQLVVEEGSSIEGLVNLRDIVTRGMPMDAKVSNFVIAVPKIEAEENVEKAARILLQSGLRAIPVTEKGKLAGIISESDMMKLVNSKKKSLEIAAPCDYVSSDDRIGKAIDTMVKKNISRVPVVKNGKLVGVVSTLNLIRLLRGREKMRGGKMTGSNMVEMGVQEKMRLEETRVETIMSKDPVPVRADATLADIAKLLRTNEEVFVVNGGISIVTPKDLLEAQLGTASRGVMVQITNLEDESSVVVDKMHDAAAEFVQKAGKMIRDIQYLFIHIERHKKSGKRTKYSVRTRFGTPLGMFVAKAWGWDLPTVSQEAIEKLEREVMKKYERLKDKPAAR